MVMLGDIMEDIHALAEELRTYERKYGVISETFYEAYVRGEEPASPAWVRDWTGWASAYALWVRRREQYRSAIQSLLAETQSVVGMIEKTARHDPIPVPA